MQWTTPEEMTWLRFSPNGLLLASARGDGYPAADNLRLHDAVTGLQVACLEEIDRVLSLAFASDRELLFVQMNVCRLWECESGVVRTIWEGPELSAVLLLPDGKSVVVALSSVILILDFPSLTLRRRLRAPPGTVVRYDNLFACGTFLAAVCTQGRENYAIIALWDLGRGKRLRTYELREDDVYDACGPEAVAVRPDGTMLAIATGRGIRAFGLETEEELEGFVPFPRGGAVLRYTPDGAALELLCRDSELVRLDARTGEMLGTWRVPATITWHRAVFDSRREKVALSAEEGVIEVLDLLDIP